MFESVCFVSRATFEDRIQPARDTVIISITDPDEQPAKIRPGFRASLRLSFLDLEEESIGVNVGDIPDLHPGHQNGIRLFWDRGELCDANDARRIVDFLCKYGTHEDSLKLVVHCHAGISRSAAVALFAADKYDCPIDQANPDTSCANSRLLRLLKKVDQDEALDIREMPETVLNRPPKLFQSSFGGVF